MSGGAIAILLGAVLPTAFISGIFGMAGGILLMGVFVWLLPVAQAMVLHGITQTVSNCSRAVTGSPLDHFASGRRWKV